MILQAVFPTNTNISTLCVGLEPDDADAFLAWEAVNTETIRLNQEHTASVLVKTKDTTLDVSQPADGILTDLPGFGLALTTADCVPILISHITDNGRVVVGAVHAGRKGTEARILKNALTLLLEHWRAGQTTIWFGPHICAECYEINRDTHETYNIKEKLQQQVATVLPAGSFTMINSDRCTKHEPEHWFSYRRQGKSPRQNWTGIRIDSF